LVSAPFQSPRKGGESEFDQEFHALPNPASLHDLGELNAYLELKMSLVDDETKAKVTDFKIQKLVDQTSPQ
jgi:hypothetical protein